MSKVTNPETEGSVTCGFFNSMNDRKYDALQFSSLFDGLITDGVFQSIGTAFVVNADAGNTVTVGIGKAWFNHTWTLNDAILPVVCDDSELLLNRIDAIVIEVDGREEVRDNFIKVIKGTPASEPVRPTMEHSTNFNQYPLCYIYRGSETTEISQADITNMVGTEETPFITGILKTISMDELLGQWEAELDKFVADEKADFDTDYQAMKQALHDAADELDLWIQNEEKDMTDWKQSEQKELDEWILSEQTDFQNWTAAEKTSFDEWFDQIKDQLTTDQAGKLLAAIEAETAERSSEDRRMTIERTLLVGLLDGEKSFSDDGTTISAVDSTGWSLVKTFTNSFLTCTSVLKDENGTLLGTLIKNFSSDGKLISTEISIP